MSATKEIESIITFRGHTDQVTCLDKSSSKPISSVIGGHLLISGADDCTVRLWDMRSAKVTKAIKGFGSTISSVGIPENPQCPFSFYVASGNEIAEFDIRNPRIILEASSDLVSRLAIGEEDINQFKFNRQGSVLLSTNDDGNLYINDISMPNESRVIGKHENISLAIAINPANAEVSSGGMDHHIKMWNLETSELVKAFDMNSQEFLSYSATTSGVNPRFVCSLDFNAGGTLLSAGLGDGSVKLFNLVPATKPKNKHQRPWRSMDLPESHRHFISKVMFLQGNERLLSGASDGELRLWRIPESSGPKKPKVGAPNKFSTHLFSKINDFVPVEETWVISGVSKTCLEEGQFGQFKPFH